MTAEEKLIRSILKQRKFLIENNLSGKNTALCWQKIEQITIQMNAYKNVWTVEGWKKFISRQKENLFLLAPNNKAGETIKNKINELSLHS